MNPYEKIIYFDNNATTKTDDEVISVMLPFLGEMYGNPSSMHTFGGQVAKDIRKAREQIATALGAVLPSEIVFTSCASESSNMAVRSILESNPEKKHLITTQVEHPCVLNLFKWLERHKNYKVTYIGVDSEGQLNLDELKVSIKEDTILVACMWANNETGVIFPIKEIGKIIKEKNPNTYFFVDAVQAFGKIPVDLSDGIIDLLSISGHKFHAPKGIGALYIRNKIKLRPLLIGGHQEKSRRAGTENVAGIVAMGHAAELAVKYLEDENTRVRALRDKLEQGIISKIPYTKINGIGTERVPNTTNISFEYIEGELILLHLSDLNICASSGSACTSDTLKPSHVLDAMGVPFSFLHGSIRFSLGRYNNEKEVDYVLEIMPQIIEKLARISPFRK